MKTIAVPLLLAGSARAQAKRKAMMQDYAIPKPILIAGSWSDGACTDSVVTAKQTALTSAQSALATLVTEAEPMQTAVDEALTAKQAAVDAVITKDGTLAANLATDDTEQQKELTLQSALDDATFAASVASAAATAALAAKTAADTAVTDAQSIQSAMTTAKTNAGTHYTAEQAQTAALTTAKNTADGTVSSLTSEVSGLQSLYDTAKTASDTSLGLTATDLEEKTAAAALLSKLTTMQSNAGAATNSGTDPSPAKTKADADTAMTSVATALTNASTAVGGWVPLANTTVKQMSLWLVTPGTYTTIGTQQLCDGVGETALTSGGPEATAEACKLHCDSLKAWRMNAGNTLPEGLVEDGSAGTGTHCYACSFATASCVIYSTAVVTAAAGAGGSAAGTVCYIRDKSTVAPTLVAALAASDVGDAKYTGMLTAIDNWANAQETINNAQGALDVADQYNTKILAAKNTQDGISTTKASDYTTQKGISDGLAATTATKLTSLTNKQNEVATATTAATLANTAKVDQEAEEARQLAIKNLADGDLTAQDLVVTAKQALQTTSDAAKTAADAEKTTKDGEQTTAQSAFDAQVTVAAGAASTVAPGLAELTTLRATSATATTALGTAQSALTAQQTLIDADQVTVDNATAAHLAAIVACKETEYDKYAAALAAAEATRTANLSTIEAIVDAAEAAKPTRGAANSRCEKAMSNGTFRPRRDEATCAEGLCCGAAKIPVGKAVMIIETCQAKDAATYSYAPPRAPMALAMPSGTDYPFTCIQGAQKLAAAASALAAAVYMLA